MTSLTKCVGHQVSRYSSIHHSDGGEVVLPFVIIVVIINIILILIIRVRCPGEHLSITLMEERMLPLLPNGHTSSNRPFSFTTKEQKLKKVNSRHGFVSKEKNVS